VTVDSPLAAPAPQFVQPAPPPPELPPPIPPAPTFPIIDAPVREPRSRKLLLSIVAGIIGTSLGVGGVTLVKKRWTAQASIPAATTTATVTASATATATTSATASASASATASGPPPTAHFPAFAARQALDAAGREIVHCRRGKVWGISSANVTFANDGTVSNVVVGVPFTGTQTGQCVVDALSTAKVPPFAGKAPVLAYRFLVPMK
jgi:hypothetical protein